VFEKADVFLADGAQPGFDGGVEGGDEDLGGLFEFAEVLGDGGGFGGTWDGGWRVGRARG
jgi:hypothetical protein